MVFQGGEDDSEQAPGICIHGTEVAAICSLKQILVICKPLSSSSSNRKKKLSENTIFELISQGVFSFVALIMLSILFKTNIYMYSCSEVNMFLKEVLEEAGNLLYCLLFKPSVGGNVYQRNIL